MLIRWPILLIRLLRKGNSLALRTTVGRHRRQITVHRRSRAAPEPEAPDTTKPPERPDTTKPPTTAPETNREIILTRSAEVVQLRRRRRSQWNTHRLQYYHPDIERQSHEPAE